MGLKRVKTHSFEQGHILTGNYRMFNMWSKEAFNEIFIESIGLYPRWQGQLQFA